VYAEIVPVGVDFAVRADRTPVQQEVLMLSIFHLDRSFAIRCALPDGPESVLLD
jgi:hypothetical protein